MQRLYGKGYSAASYSATNIRRDADVVYRKDHRPRPPRRCHHDYTSGSYTSKLSSNHGDYSVPADKYKATEFMGDASQSYVYTTARDV